MKSLFIVVIASILATVSVSAQRYAIIDTKYILEKLPEYKEADRKMKAFSDLWQKEIDDKQMALDRMYKDYDIEKFMLTDELRKSRETEMTNKEKEIKDLQRKRFGFDGDLFKQRQKLVKPVQDKVFNAVQKIASSRNFDFILDKSEGITVIFADPKLDKSDDVLRELGVR